jgi:hypothetical protein
LKKITKPDLLKYISLTTLSFAYGLYRWLMQIQRGTIIHPDSQDYLLNATAKINLDFFCYPKPAGAALVYKLLNNQYNAIISFQILFSIFSWIVLAVCIFSLLKNRPLQYLGFLLILVISINPDVLDYDLTILSESISTSLFILLVSSAIFMVRKWSIFSIILFGSIAFLWGLTKETNGLILIMLSVIFMIWGLIVKSKSRLLALSVFLLVAAMLFRGFSNLGERWRFPLLNNIAQRILPDEEGLAFFVQNGMPVNETLMDLTYGWGHSNDKAFLNSPALRDFQGWFLDKGQTTYIKYLFRFPEKSFFAPLQNFPALISNHEGSLHNPLYPNHWHPLVAILYFFLLSISIFFLIRHTDQSMLWLLTIYLLLVYPQAFIVWNGDAMEVTRHAVGFRIYFWTGMYIAGLYGTDHAKTNWRPLSITPKTPVSTIEFSSPRSILSRGLLAGGILIVAFSLLHDLLTAADYQSFHYAIGKMQSILMFGGLIVFLSGAFLQAKRPQAK